MPDRPNRLAQPWLGTLALPGAALGFSWVFSNDPGLTLTGPLF